MFPTAGNLTTFGGQVLHKEFETFIARTVTNDKLPAVAQESTKTFDTHCFTTYGTPLTPIDQSNPDFTTLAATAGLYGNARQRHSSDNLFRNVTHKILTAEGTFTYIEALEYIERFVTTAKEHFYGALLRGVDDTDLIINPYHPMTALSTITANYRASDIRFTVMLYFFSDRKSADAYYNSNRVDYPAAVEAVGQLIRSASSSKQVIVRNFRTELAESNLEQLSIRYHIVAQRLPEELMTGTDITLDGETSIVAHQVLTSGTIIPYYAASGLTFPKPKESPRGFGLTPFCSCNIASSGTTTKGQITFGSVCCGSENNRTLAGLSVLNHSNLGSPYVRKVISDGALTYAVACLNVTRDIYQKAGYLATTFAVEMPVAKVTEFDFEAYKADKEGYTAQLIALGVSPSEIAALVQQQETNE